MEITSGQIMFYGGIAGTIICSLVVIILLKTFDKVRRSELEKIMSSL